MFGRRQISNRLLIEAGGRCNTTRLQRYIHRSSASLYRRCRDLFIEAADDIQYYAVLQKLGIVGGCLFIINSDKGRLALWYTFVL